MKYAVVALAVLAFFETVLTVYGDSSIGLVVWPRIAYAHGYAQLRVQVERNDANRKLIWEIDGPDYYRSSTIQLDGASSPKNWFFLVQNLPEGDFMVRATVRRNNDTESMAQSMISVKGSVR